MECAVCGEQLADDEPRNTVAGDRPVCTDAKACIARWVARQQRTIARRLDPASGAETRG